MKRIAIIILGVLAASAGTVAQSTPAQPNPDVEKALRAAPRGS
jgi:hypothetical protein